MAARIFAHLAVGAHVHDRIVTGKAEVLHQADRFRQHVSVGRHRAALERVEELGRVEA